MVRNATDEILVSYAFDVSMWHGVPFLTYYKVFTIADQEIPDGIKCDLNRNNVYDGCRDEINIWFVGRLFWVEC